MFVTSDANRPANGNAPVLGTTSAAPPPHTPLPARDIAGDKRGLNPGGTLTLGLFEVDFSLGWIETFDRTVNASEKAQVNPIYLADPGPYGDGDPSYVGNGTYAARNIILATTPSPGLGLLATSATPQAMASNMDNESTKGKVRYKCAALI